MTSFPLAGLCKKLHYHFLNASLLEQALTHCSKGHKNYERLEFLGDAVLNFIITKLLYQQFPEKSEGQLSRLRAFLVKGEMLHEIALELKLSDYLRLGAGELRSGAFRRSSILADVVEALVAAVYLDGGLEAAETLVQQLYASRLADPQLAEVWKDAKTQLQELLQAKKKPLPEYTLLQVLGHDHNQVFCVSCSVAGIDRKAEGQGETRKKAEQEAAKRFLREPIL